jgi:2-polyprenyl-6-methoxyphenol hydroxylase-like FAD-dependent oxidoreductase
MRRRDLRVLIAGGGIGGITTALALRQRGIDAVLFEQAEAFREVGAGIQLSANATRVLRTLGLGEPLARVGIYPEGRDYRAWDTGERVFWTPLGEQAEVHFGAPYYQVHRADLLGILVNALGDTGIHLNAHVQALEQDGHSVTMTLANGRTVTGDVLVGADGIHSTVRAQLFGREQPRYTGCVAWRGLVPAERLTHLDLGRVNGIWIGPNRSMVQYYVSAGRMFNWVGISRSAHAAQESWLAEGRAEDALAEYADWHPAIRAIIGATPRVLRQALYDREPLAEWGVGRVVLLGDAAHPMMPFYAQGAGQSIEDAYILAGCVALWPDEPVAALQQYARLRQPRTAWIQQLSRREEELYHLADPAEIARRNTTLRQNQSLSAAAFPPEQERLYSYNAEAVLRS